MQNWHPNVVYVFGKLVSCPLFFAIGEIELTNRVTIEGSLVPFDHGVMSVDPHGGMIVRDRKREDLPVQLFLALHVSKEYDKSP